MKGTEMFTLEEKLLAEWMHNQYQDICKNVTSWKVQESTDRNFNELPQENKQTMFVLARRLIKVIDDRTIEED